jgi:hypothetical protein
MGWISKRMMRNRAKWGPPISAEKRRAPLRRIEYVIHPRRSMFDSDFVRLECGHEVFAYGDHRARCTYCQRSV